MYVGRTNISSCKCLCLDTFLLLSRLKQCRVYGTEYTIDWIFISIDIIFFFYRKWINQSNTKPVRNGSKFLEVWLNNHDNYASNFRNTAALLCVCHIRVFPSWFFKTEKAEKLKSINIHVLVCCNLTIRKYCNFRNIALQ